MPCCLTAKTCRHKVSTPLRLLFGSPWLAIEKPIRIESAGARTDIGPSDDNGPARTVLVRDGERHELATEEAPERHDDGTMAISGSRKYRIIRTEVKQNASLKFVSTIIYRFRVCDGNVQTSLLSHEQRN